MRCESRSKCCMFQILISNKKPVLNSPCLRNLSDCDPRSTSKRVRCHSVGCLFLSGSQWWTLVPSPETMQDRKAPPPRFCSIAEVLNRCVSWLLSACLSAFLGPTRCKPFCSQALQRWSSQLFFQCSHRSHVVVRQSSLMSTSIGRLLSSGTGQPLQGQ